MESWYPLEARDMRRDAVLELRYFVSLFSRLAHRVHVGIWYTLGAGPQALLYHGFGFHA